MKLKIITVAAKAELTACQAEGWQVERWFPLSTQVSSNCPKVVHWGLLILPQGMTSLGSIGETEAGVKAIPSALATFCLESSRDSYALE